MELHSDCESSDSDVSDEKALIGSAVLLGGSARWAPPKNWEGMVNGKKRHITKAKQAMLDEAAKFPDLPILFLWDQRIKAKKAKKELEKKNKAIVEVEYRRAKVLEKDRGEMGNALTKILTTKRHSEWSRKEKWTWEKVACALIARVEQLQNSVVNQL